VSLVNYVYVVEYDLPTKDPSRRVYFYQKVHRAFLKHFQKPIEFSSYSCYFSEDEQVAKMFYDIAKQFCTRVAMYKAQELERFGKRESKQ
jgi:predicted enzyme related to lactoylglutathione lyase